MYSGLLGLIATEAVTKRYGGLAAVDAVTLEFPRGVSCLIGPNGAGKSTLLDLLSGRQETHCGSRDTRRPRDLTKREPFLRAREGIGTKLQVASIFESLTVRENLWLACYAMPRDIEKADRRAASLLEWLDLRDEAERAAGTLSHGKKQWLEIGMVVATDPSVVLLDEPTAGMTREETARTANLVRELGRAGFSDRRGARHGLCAPAGCADHGLAHGLDVHAGHLRGTLRRRPRDRHLSGRAPRQRRPHR